MVHADFQSTNQQTQSATPDSDVCILYSSKKFYTNTFYHHNTYIYNYSAQRNTHIFYPACYTLHIN